MVETTNRDLYNLAMAYHNGSISEQILKDICKKKNCKCEIDDVGGVMISQNR